MRNIPAPTLDQITGYTVMEKMRSLIKNYVNTIGQVIDRVEDTVTQEEIATYLEQYLSDYYTKEEVDEIIENLDLSDYYTKSETDTLLSTKANSSDVYAKSEVYSKSEVYNKTETDNLLSAKANSSNVYAKSEVYNKTETDNLLSTKANSNNVYTKSETDTLLSTKQDELTAGTGITIQNNVISATGGSGSAEFKLANHIRWSEFFDTTNSPYFVPLYDIIVHTHIEEEFGTVDKDTFLKKGRKYFTNSVINMNLTRPDINNLTNQWILQWFTNVYNMFKPENDTLSALTYTVNRWYYLSGSWDSRAATYNFVKNIDPNYTPTGYPKYIELYYLE